MADNVIKVSVTSTKSQRVSVSSSQQATNITASPDTGRFWSQTSKNWAVSENIVDGEDYSSKYYANKSKQSAQNAEGYLQSTRETYNTFVSDANDYRSELTELKDAGAVEINKSVASGKDEINSTKTTIINDIEFVADGEKQEIQGLADDEKEEIKDLANLIKENAQDIASRTSFAMFDTVLKDHILTYEESKGLALQGTYVYKEAVAGSRYGYAVFYNKVVEEYNEATTTETVNGVTVKVHSNGHKFYDIADKEAIDGFFNSMGTAWFYGVDTKNERIFLPRNNYFEQATGDVSEVGQSVEAGLPNITGGFNVTTGAPHWCTGAFSNNKAGQSNQNNGGYNASREGATFDASRSSAIYGNSDTVQPNAVKKLLYICVGNTVADTSWIDVVTQVKGGVKDLEDKKNTSIAEIDANAKSYDNLTKRQITNCLLEVPQRIKLELNNGVLTLKAGSKVIVPNGFEADGTTPKFDEVVIGADLNYPLTHGTTNLRTVFYFGRANGLDGYAGLSVIFSGSTAPTIPSGTNYAVWYDTAQNIIKTTSNGGSTWDAEARLSFPLCYGAYENNVGFTSIDKIFNGMGYIGSTVWVDKGVKCLIPNGRNEDGSLKNVEFVTDKLLRNTSFNTNANIVEARLVYNGSDITLTRNTPSNDNFYFDYKNNYYHRPDGTQKTSIDAVTMSTTTNGIQTFEPKLPFRAVDYNEFTNTPHITETYQNGSSWYRVYSDGWCEQGGKGASGTTVTVTFLKPFRNTNYAISGIKERSASQAHPVNVTSLTTTSAKLVTYGDAAPVIWRAGGYIS